MKTDVSKTCERYFGVCIHNLLCHSAEEFWAFSSIEVLTIPQHNHLYSTLVLTLLFFCKREKPTNDSQQNTSCSIFLSKCSAQTNAATQVSLVQMHRLFREKMWREKTHNKQLLLRIYRWFMRGKEHAPSLPRNTKQTQCWCQSTMKIIRLKWTHQISPLSDRIKFKIFEIILTDHKR